MSYVSNLDQPLLRLSASDHFSLRDAVQGVHIFGGIGSGKTSGSGKALAAAYNTLRGVTVNAGVPSSPKAAVPN